MSEWWRQKNKNASNLYVALFDRWVGDEVENQQKNVKMIKAN